MNFQLSRQAQDALDKLWDYYCEQGGTRLADRILAQIRDTIDLLIEHPQRGHWRRDLTDKPFRFYRIYNFFLIYDPQSSPLYIARVYHSAQDIKSRMETEPD